MNNIKEFMQTDTYKNAVKNKLDLINLEREVLEEAEWFDSTGLTEDFEREVAHYLRLEFGESLFDESSLKANELIYLGKFSSRKDEYYIWQIQTKNDESLYAYILFNEIYEGLFGIGGSELEKLIC